MAQTPLRIGLIGLGKRGLHRALREILKGNRFCVVAFCDPNEAALQQANAVRPGVANFRNVDDLLIAHRSTENPFRLDCAYVAIPHWLYGVVVPKILKSGIHVLKEKPAALTTAEAQAFHNLAEQNCVRLMTASQGRFGEQYETIASSLPTIGSVRSIEATRKINVPHLDSGWRAQKTLAGGGVVKDLGWHVIDVILGLLGDTYQQAVSFTRMTKTKTDQHYDCEDSAQFAFDLVPKNRSEELHDVPCCLHISRVCLEEVDEIYFVGTKGILRVRNEEIVRHLYTPLQVFRVACTKKSDFARLITSFAAEICRRTPSSTYQRLSEQDLKVCDLIDRIYSHTAGRQNSTSLHPTQINANEAEHGKDVLSMSWPKMTRDVLEDILAQAQTSISIYGNDGVFGDFEREFKCFIGRAEFHALLHNSGTNAMQALYYAAGLVPGDEVIFPVYTFHATCSPAMTFGVTPVFVDTGDDGNISPEALPGVISSRTRAVVITHMWGFPCKMSRILQILRRYKDILLFEDCSHAHGARIDGQSVGTFGDGSVWSLQGQKVISAGEGGITVTRHKEFLIKQLLWGHYNKRCKLEIPKKHGLHKYSLTGAGRKNRAHPVGIAIAANQLRKHSIFESNRTRFAEMIASSVSKVPFLKVPDFGELRRQHIQPSWYAFVFYFQAEKAPTGLTRERFVEELHSEGLSEFDIPRSTRLLHQEPLFTSPHDVLPHIYDAAYSDRNSSNSFPRAAAVHGSLIKLPVWAYSEDR